MSVASQAGAWISELRVRRNMFGLALDLTGLMIPVERLSPVECVAIIQTLLAESGFEFQNVIPVWSEARISKVHSELFQLVCDDLQRLLSVELLEWRQLISQATRRFLSAEEVDVLMTVPDGYSTVGTYIHETIRNLLLENRTFTRQVTASGLRRSRSPQSSVGEPKPNRPQHQPPAAEAEHVFDSVSASVIPIFGCDDSRCQARGPKYKFHEEFIRIQLWNLSGNGRFR
ncbi:hypothetical protein PHMEG_00021567 [Phytophthora megakarya]|uniref:Uncharacterized protein n=1 Tax=Phytophthora megakarya TaxID=4795 RepID=A0A225VKW4_9STRA|nr:hypothetical protein PHMEG_00021567 [Phytophthora megakarya]